MKINHSIKTPEGTVQFQGELSQEEADLVIEAGLAIMLRMGVFNVIKAQEGQQTIILN